MEKEIKNKVIVITGGAEGIGFQIAKNYLKENAKVVFLVDINEVEGNKAVEELISEFGADKAVFIRCDVVEDLEDTYHKICNEYNNTDVLINSAGIANELDVKKCVDVNLIATMQWSMKFLEHMRKDNNGNGGTIINIASIFGYRTAKFCPIYQATKFGVVGFTKCLGDEKNYNKHGVRVVAICPGFTKSSMTKPFLEAGDEEFMEIQREHLWQSVEDVGENAVEVFKKADSGSLWQIEGGVLNKVV